MEWDKFKRKLMSDPEFASEYEDLASQYQFVREVIVATQSEILSEVKRRAQALDSGEVRPISAEEVRRKARELLQ
jgi:hypothetical protein